MGTAIDNSNKVAPVSSVDSAALQGNRSRRSSAQASPSTELFSNFSSPAKTTLKFTISSFPFNQTALGEKGRQKLDEIVKAANRMKDYSITIIGHADSQTIVQSANWKVSENRAQTAKNYLVSQGLDPQRIYTEGASDTQPITSNDTPEGRAQNRRVDVKLDGTPKQ